MHCIQIIHIIRYFTCILPIPIHNITALIHILYVFLPIFKHFFTWHFKVAYLTMLSPIPYNTFPHISIRPSWQYKNSTATFIKSSFEYGEFEHWHTFLKSISWNYFWSWASWHWANTSSHHIPCLPFGRYWTCGCGRTSFYPSGRTQHPTRRSPRISCAIQREWTISWRPTTSLKSFTVTWFVSLKTQTPCHSTSFFVIGQDEKTPWLLIFPGRRRWRDHSTHQINFYKVSIFFYILPSLRFRAVGCGVRRAGPRMRRAHIYA